MNIFILILTLGYSTYHGMYATAAIAPIEFTTEQACLDAAIKWKKDVTMYGNESAICVPKG